MKASTLWIVVGLCLCVPLVAQSQLAEPVVRKAKIGAHREELGPPPGRSSNAMHFAAYRNDLKKARLLLAADPSLLNSVDDDNRTPLHYAAATGSIEVLRFLLDHRANPDMQSKEGVTPLAWAMEYTQLDAFKLLLERHANTELARNEDGLQMPPLSGHLKMHGSDDYGIPLVMAGADVNHQDRSGWMPLLYATDGDASLTMLQLLIGHGANVNCHTPTGLTPLHFAASHGNFRAVRLLLACGSNPYPKDAQGRTPSDLFPPGAPYARQVFDKYVQACKMQEDSAPSIAPTKAECRRIVYQLASNQGFGNWESNPNGELVGPLQWSRSPSGRAYLGPFNQQTVTLNLSKLPRHKNVQVEIELFIIGSWDGNGGLGSGPDVMDIRIPGLGTLLHSTFFNNTEGEAADVPLQSYPDPFPGGLHRGHTGASAVGSLGFHEVYLGVDHARDAVYKLRFTFAHSDRNLAVALSGMTVPQLNIRRLTDDENWGIAGLTIKTDTSR